MAITAVTVAHGASINAVFICNGHNSVHAELSHHANVPFPLPVFELVRNTGASKSICFAYAHVHTYAPSSFRSRKH